MNQIVSLPQRPLGRSGLMVSAVGLGCNNFGGRLDLAGTRAVVHRALDAGITLFDTADAYGNKGGSESYLGEVLGARRREIVLASKFGLPMDNDGLLKGASRRYIMSAVEASLKRLRTDWIDLYQVHRPDPLTPIEETLRALDDLVEQGKVRHVGCSNFSAAQVIAAQETSARAGLVSFVTCQDEYSLLVRGIEQDLLPTMREQGLSLLPYFPLAGGFLTGKYKQGAAAPEGARLAAGNPRFINDRSWSVVAQLGDLCARRGRSMLELAFGWLLANPAVASVIAGASKPEQVEQNVRAINWTLSPGDVADVNRIAA
jgi:aryl-alcohol dehydrogenase-like predicted oxidoreductase